MNQNQKYMIIVLPTLVLLGLSFWFITIKVRFEARLKEADIHIETLQDELLVVRNELQEIKTKVLLFETQEILGQEMQLTSGIADSGDSLIKHSSGVSTPVEIDSSLSAQETGGSAELSIEPDDFEKGKQALANGYYETAINSLKKVEPTHKQYLESRLDIANAYFFSQQYEQAVTAYEELLRLEPESVEALVGLANTYNSTGKKGEQIAAYTKVITLEPERWLHYNSRGSALYQNGNYDRAIDDFIHAAKLAQHSKADQAVVLENIGLIHLQRENWLLAFQHSANVNNIEATRSWNWLIRGIAALKISYSNDAWTAFEYWFKYKRPTDAFLIKQFLPEPLKEFADLTPAKLAKLIDPPVQNGELCVNDAQCASYYCAPGPPDNKVNYCAEKRRDCAAHATDGYKTGQKIESEIGMVRCYRPDVGPGRWTVDDR